MTKRLSACIIVFWCVWDTQRLIIMKKVPGFGITWCGFDYKYINPSNMKILGMYHSLDRAKRVRKRFFFLKKEGPQ